MAKQGEANLYLLSIVAIVAIVGIVVLILQGSGMGSASTDDVTGEAFKISSSGLKVPSTSTGTSTSLGYGSEPCNPACDSAQYCVDRQCIDKT